LRAWKTSSLARLDFALSREYFGGRQWGNYSIVIRSFQSRFSIR
jgi:hypothetical protein